MDSDSEGAEADVTEYRYVDRGEEFLDVEETPPQTIVFRSVHRSHTTTGTTATSVQAASPTSLVASSGYDSSASTDTQLYLVTSRSAESPDAVNTQSVTHGSLVTSSGYDSSASTDTRDFTFGSPVTSPERDPTASSDIAGASGGFLVTSSGVFPPSPQDTQSATDSSLLVSSARDSETATDVQGFSDTSFMTSSDQSWSVGRPEVEPCSAVHGDVGGEPSEAEHRGQVVEGHSDSDQGDDADREEGDEGSSEDGEISDEDLVSSYGEEFDADVLSAFSVTTETAAETADGGELDDSAAAKGRAFSASEIVDETALCPDTELETEADTFSLDVTTYVDRWEGYLGSEDLPRVATIVFRRVREDDREDEGEGHPDAHSSIASAGTLTAKEETHSTSTSTCLHVEAVSPTSDCSTDLTAPHVGGERGSSVEVTAADPSLSVVGGAGAVPVSDSRSVSSVYVDYRKTVGVDVDSAVTRVDKTKDTQDAGSEQTVDSVPSEEGDRGRDAFSDKRDANTDTVRDTRKPTTTTTPVTDDRKTTSPEDPPGVPTIERHGPSSLGPRFSYRREVVSQDGPEPQRSQRDGDTPRYISTLCIPPYVPRNAETKPPPSDTDTEEEEGVEDGSSSEAGGISEGATATASLAQRGRESHTVTASLYRSFGATFDVGRPRTTTTTTHTAAAAAVGTVALSAGQWSQVSQVTTSYLQGDGRTTENRDRQWATAGTETESESEVFVREERSETAALHGDAERLVMQTGARGDIDIGVGSAGGAQTDPSVGETRIEPDDNEVGISDALCSASDAEASQEARSLEASEEERESGKLCYFSQKVSDDDDTSDDEGDSRKVSHLDIFVSDYSEQEKYSEYRDLCRSEDYSQDENYTKSTVLIQRRDYSQPIEYAEHKDYAKHEDADDIDREHYPEQDVTKHKDDTRHKDETKHKDYFEVHFHYPVNGDYLDATGDTTHTDYIEHTGYSTHEDYSEHEGYPEHKGYSELEYYSEDKEYSEQTDHSALHDSDHEDHSGHEDDDTGTASAMATEAADPVGRPTSHDEWFVDRGEEFVVSWEPHRLSYVQFRLSPQSPDSDTVCSFEGTASIDASSLTLERPVDTADESVEDERKEKEEDEDTKEEKEEEEEEEEEKEEEVCDEPEVQDDLKGDEDLDQRLPVSRDDEMDTNGDEIDVQNASDDNDRSEPSEDEDDDRDEDDDTATGVAHSSDMRVGEKSEADVSALTTERYEGHAGPAATMESATMAAPSKLREEDDDEERKEESENGDEEEADDETDEEEYMDENADDEFEVTMTPDDTDRTPASGGFFISDDSGSSDDADEEPPPGDQAPREEGGEEVDVAKDAGVEEKVDRVLGAVDTDSETAIQKADDGDAGDNKEDTRDRGTGDVEGLKEEGREDEEEEAEHEIKETEDEVVGKEEEGLEEEEDEKEEEEVEHEIKERDDEVVGKEEEGLEEEKEEEDEEEVEHETKERDDEVVGKEEEGLEEEEDEEEEEEVEHEIKERDDEVVGKEEEGLEEEKEEDDEEEDEVEYETKERDDEIVGKEEEGLEEEEEEEVEHEIKERDDEVVGKEEEGLEEEKEEEDEEEEEVEHETKERDDEMVGKEEERLEEEEEKEEEDDERKMKQEIEEGTGGDTKQEEEEKVGTEQESVIRPPLAAEAGDSVTLSAQSGTDDKDGDRKYILHERTEQESVIRPPLAAEAGDSVTLSAQSGTDDKDGDRKYILHERTEQESVIRPPLAAEAGDSVTLSAQSGTDDKDSDRKYILHERTELLVGAGGGGDDGSGDDDDDDDHDDSDTDAAEQKMPEFRDTEDLDTREAAVSEDEEKKSGDDDTLDNLAETVCGASSLEDRAADSSARETGARADTVVGPQPTAPCELSDVSALTRQGVDVRFVDRGEEFADVFFRPTVKRERDGGSSPSEPQEQRLLDDIKSNRARTEVVLEEHAALRDRSGETTPSQGHRLLQEIGQLEETAEYQCTELRAAVAEQEQYETEIRHLNAAISEAQQQLLASPVRASTVEALKQQIAEHNSLASQIKSYQATVSEINEKSRQLSLRVAQASTVTSRKRYLPEMVYRNWVSVSRSDTGIEAHSSPVSSVSHTMDSASFDSGLDTGANLSQSMQTSPSLSMTLQSQSSLGSRPPTFPSTPRTTTGEAERFKPISDSSKLDSSTSFRSDASDSFVSHPSDTSVKSIRWSSHLQPPVDSYKVKSASDTHLHGSSSFMKKLQGQGEGSGTDKQEMAAGSQELRVRSSSFGQKVEPLGRPLGSAPPVEELNQSWNTLQTQVANKERELQQALQKQEKYQQAVQELTAKMERAQISLARTPASVAADIDTQLKDYKETLSELESIKEDITVVRERGRQIMEVSDAEGSKAMEATLTMLGDRITSLQTLADHKGKQLQDVLKHKKKHDIALSAYKKRVSDLESWLGEMKVRHATTPLPTDEPTDIQQQLQDNRELQEDLNARLQLISDLAVQCDNLCELEPPGEAEKLRNQLSGLHTRLGDFKLSTIEKQNTLRAALKDSEKRLKEMDDYETRVSKLQQWMTDTKQMTIPGDSTPITMTMADRSQLHQDLASDLSEHQQLVRQLAVTQRGAEKGPRSASTERKLAMAPTMSEAELHAGWQTLQKDLAQKTEQLERILQRRKSGEAVTTQSGSMGDTSRQLQDIQSLVSQLSMCWQQLQVQVEDKQLRLDTALSFQQQMQSALTAMSAWLDTAEQIVLAPSTGAQSEHDRIRQNEALQRELRSLQSEIATLSGQAHGLLSQSSGQSHGLIQESLTNLNQRVSILEKQAVSRGDELRQAQHQWQQYHDDVRTLRSRMQELQTTVMGPPTTSTATLDSLISNINTLETQLKKCESQLDELRGREKELSTQHPRGAVPSELGTLRSSYMELQRKLVERKAGLLQSVSVQEQYQKMLKDYADFLETAEGKLKTESISARDLPHLRQQLSAHKEFFCDLEVHKAMLDSLASQCDQATQEAHSMQHTRLSNLTHVLADQASLHGQRLERLVRQWSDLVDKLGHLQQFLTEVEEGIPKPIASGDSLATIQEKLGKFKRLQGQLSDERPTVFQAVDRGKQILHSVGCPALEAAITELADKWVELNTLLMHELKKTETIGEQLQTFEAEAMVLKTWMSTARMRLEDLKRLSEDDMQNIGNIRTKVEHILEFRKEVQNQLPLKSKVMSVGKQLMANRNYDTRGLDARLEAIEEEWNQLEHSINTAEQSLHQAQMELMPSRQALHELQVWMEEMEKALDADANSPIKTLADIEVMLKKYKGYKVELASKQLTMEFVNQSVLQPGPHEIDVPHEKLDYAEKLAELNQHWTKVSNDINERLQSLEQLSGKWADYEAALAQLQSWFHQQEDKIKRYRLIGHEVGVKQTLKDCKAMQDQLLSRKEDLESIKLLGQSLIELSRESPGCQRSVRESLATLSQQWEHLQQQMMQLESLLTDMLGQWARYHADLHSLSQVLAQTEYTLNRYSLVGADMQTLLNQVDKLKSLEKELKQHSSHLDSFSTLATQLCQVCEPPVQAEVQSTVSDIRTKWSKLSADLSTRRAQFERCLSKWREYEREYEKINGWLSQKEVECSELVAMREDVSARQECLEKSQALQQELDEIQTQLSALYRLSDELTKNMGTSTIVLLTSRQSAIEQRLVTLRQLLSQHIQGLHEDLSQVNRFREAFATVKIFLEHAGMVLSTEDPNKTAEQPDLQNRLDQLKELLTQFQANSGKLDEVNDLGYRLALDASDSSQLLELNHQWHKLHAECQERSKALQSHLLVQQDFTAKCQTWMAFLATTERDLASEIAGNLPDLLEQQRKCRKFESEMYSHQQVLHAIISDGQKMMRAGEVEDPKGFEQKLRLLSEQWQSVIRRATQRKNIIDNTIQDWHMFNSLGQQLHTWLGEKEESLKMFEFDKLSLQQIRNLLDKVKTIQSEFKMQEDSFRKVHDLGATLLQRADPSAAQEIKVVTAQLQNGWLEVYNRLEEHRVRLEALQGDWRECEEDIEEILTWLKSIRQMLNADIPNTYDGLQADLTRCRDIATSFDNSEDKRQRLQAWEKKLSRVIQAEDMNVLHQRIRLLNKQWEELKSQAGLRDHRLQDSTFRWSNLGEQMRALMDWMDDMEVKIVSSREVHVEDLLNKLETEYDDAMTLKGREVEEVIARGQQLMKNSSVVRASDIEQRLQRLQDKWNHLLGVADFRKRKLQETVLAVKQLESSMRNLSHWLATMEQELNTPVIYYDCDMQEIHTKLQHTQEIQHDIEHHSAGVSSVLNLCEVLLHDSDACPTETEFEALQHAMKNLDRRWKTLCGLCPERRARIKETWELWEVFSTDCRRFSEWLSTMEVEVGDAEADMPTAVGKDEIRKYEALQRKVHDRLTDLESINKQYRRLAKEGRADNKGVLRSRMQEANDRWDALQQRVTDMMQGLRHSASIREDFLTTRLSLMQWLTEVDMQITNIEHLSQLDIPTKIKEIQRIEEEVDDRRHRMDYLNQAAVLLMQQGSEEEAVRVQQELDEFRHFSRQVLDRVDSCRATLHRISAAQVEDIAKLEERERYAQSEQSTEFLRGQRPATADWDTRELEAYLESSPPESPPHKRRAEGAGLPKASVSPIRRSMSPPRRSTSPSRRSASPTRRSLSPSRRSTSPSRWSRDVTDSGDWRTRERNAKIDVLVEQLVDAVNAATNHLDVAERQMETYSSADSTLGQKQLQSMLECETQVDTVLRLDRLLKIEAGSATIPTVDTQVSNVVSRWERLQSRASERNLRISQQQRDLSKFSSDVDSLLMWLDEAEALQASHDTMPSDIAQLNVIIRQHKDFMVQLEAKRARFLSIQLLSKTYINVKTAEGRQLQSRVRELERRWEAVTARASDTQHRLQGALLQCQEFHHTVQDYLLWLEGMESRMRCCEPIRLSSETSLLWDKYNMLRDLRSELEENQSAVMTLRETADQLLVSGELPEMSSARDKTHIISNRLRSLLHLTAAYIESLETKLGIKSSSVDTRVGRLPSAVHPTLRTRTRSPFAVLRQLLFGAPPISLPADQPESANLTTDPESLSASPSYLSRRRQRGPLLHRVLRTALPLQVLLLLLLGVACLVPLCEDDYSCLLVNNLRHSLSPMLRYTDGAPPT